VLGWVVVVVVMMMELKNVILNQPTNLNGDEMRMINDDQFVVVGVGT